MTINEGLIRLKSLRDRHTELIGLRNGNSNIRTRYFGRDGDKEVKDEPTYDVRKLDRLVTGVATEIRLLETAIKVTNASQPIVGYTPNEDAFGQVE